MALLSAPRLEALRLIREQLSCTLCGHIFQDPQCLDCKHNFCRHCILLHLKQNNSHCPMCQLPTRPSEVTRNQFLESILAAWNSVETELEALNNPTLHAGIITVEDTDRALHRAASRAGTSVGPDESQQERQKPRGRVANHKWNIDTQEIRQELKLEQPYLPQHYGSRQGSTTHWKKTSSSDLPDDYGGSQGRRNEQSVENDTCSREEQVDVQDEEFVSPTTNSLMATQEVESYLDRITKQREALSQWERTNQGVSDGKSSLMDLERSLHSSNGFNELIQERRRESQHDADGDLLTQMTQMTQTPASTSALESPDVLASFRRRNHTDNNESDIDRRAGMKAKRRVIISSPLPLHPRISSPSRKRLRMPTPEVQNYQNYGRSTASAIDLSHADSGYDEREVPDSQPNTMLPDEEHKSSEKDEEEEYEMKPAVPLPPTTEPKNSSPDRHCERLRNLFSRKKERVSDDFRSAITAFQSDDKHCSDSPQSQAAKKLVSMVSHSKSEVVAAPAKKERDTTRPNSAGSSARPPVHTSSSSGKSSTSSESGSGFVFVSSDLNRDEVKHVLEATHRLGGRFGHDFDLKRDPVTGYFSTSVTHLITKAVPSIGALSGEAPDELRCKRTAKYMRALAEGSFIMDFSWITASLSTGRWLTEDPFEMIGDIYSDAVGKPHEGRIRRAQTGRRNSIFSMFCFVLLVPENEFDFQFASVKALVNNFGGTVVQAENFAKLNPKQRSRRTPVGVVSKTTLPSDAKAKWQKFHIPIVRITWIFDSVSHLEVLPFDDYYPY